MIYEVITGTVKIEKRKEFVDLHKEFILPLYAKFNLHVVCCLLTEVGDFGKFIDVYEYDSYDHYEKTSELIFTQLNDQEYYPKISECIIGNISVSLMIDFKDV